MPVSQGTDTQIQNLIDLSLKGDESAKEALLHHACDRLLRLTRRAFRNYPYLRRWEATDDVFQNAMVRLHRALREVRVESVRHFFNLAGLQIRRELNDLTRHYFGPEGEGANHHTDHKPADDAGGSLDRSDEPEDLAHWTLFHEHCDKLPDEEREVVNLLFYQGLTQEEASRVLGMPLRTLKRRWFAARTRLHEALSEDGADR
jgi:RNA polymerase sigma-70 factor (ECF subfamily)